MLFCLKRELAAGCFGVIAVAGSLPAASLSKRTVVVPRVRSVVRADAHCRLVRTVVVSPRVIQPRIVESQPAAVAATAVAVSVPEMVQAAAKKYDVDPLLVHSVIAVESGYNPYAVSPKGAQGLMQLMPGTARRFGVSNTFDPVENIDGGVRYLKYLLTLFPHDRKLAVAAYNAGEGAVWKYNYQIPPYPETEQYVYKVARKYGQARRAADAESADAQSRTEAAAAPQPDGPVYAPVQAYVDEQGRLHMRNAVPETGTP